MNYTVIREDELYHHGILGQKWGVRRYQNEDGSLTAAGRRRYGEDLDIHDKSRENIAKIRLGEARRRLDVAKKNSETKGRNDYRVAEMRARVRSAKAEVKKQKKIDRGAKLAAEGKLISEIKGKQYIKAPAAAFFASWAWGTALQKGVKGLGEKGQLAPHHIQTANILAKAGDIAIGAGLLAYAAKSNRQISDLRAYNNSRYGGANTINRVGSQEYKDVVERRKEKK
ncbi:MAG: hypothetical protein J6U54_25125 [Clostridiales bacterium]|nr:hypothetical protein [Clostridiales bacterium]